ncbi:M16 family metallopeptidase [Taibaiella koreensis]|uniref:M16 family metallopeptidase n=1 Tax=Taibaiella koreensis TaxID=1268548 RepID=UPI000E59D5BF|nr:insulinase family protein [Taibaiella koreensis]
MKNKAALLLLIVLLAQNATNLFAQQGKYKWEQGSSGGYDYKYVSGDPMKTRFYTLKNGLTVILTENKKEPRIAMKIAVRTGSNNDPRDHTGLAHYLEHLLFKGTEDFGTTDYAKEKPYLDRVEALYETYGQTKDNEQRKAIYREIDSVSGLAAKISIAGEYNKMMSDLGSQGTNAGTWLESTVYDENVPSSALNKLLRIQADRFRNPVLRLFHTELEAVYEEKNRALDNDDRKLLYALHENLFPTTNYGQQTTIGTIEHLKNPSIKAIKAYYEKYYVPNNMAVILAGDFNTDAAIKLIDQYFAYMKPKAVSSYEHAPEPEVKGPIVTEIFGPSAERVQIGFRTGPEGSRERLLVDITGAILFNGEAGLIDLNLNKQQKVLSASAERVQIGFRTGPEGSRERLLVDITGAILFNGEAGLIDLNLNKQQKVLSASAGLDFPYKDYGIFKLSASARQNQSLEEVKDLLLSQVALIKKGDFDESLLKAIVANQKLSQIRGLSSNDNRVEQLSTAFINNRGEGWYKDVAYIDDLSKVTKQEIVAFANQFFKEDNYTVLYKRKGEDKNIVKVEKPAITPVETNAGLQSAYIKKINEMPSTPVAPLWIDYDKAIGKAQLGPADMLYVPNKNNDLFSLYYRFDMGQWNNKKLSVASNYLSFLSTDKYTSEQISKAFYDIACSYNISVDQEFTTVTISGLQENFEKAVQLFEHIITHCQPNEDALAALKGRMQKSRADYKLNKNAIIGGLYYYATYGAKNPFNYTLTNEELNNLNSEELIKSLHDLLLYKHTVMYYGPAALDKTTALLQRHHPLPEHFLPYPGGIAFTRSQQTANQVLFANYDMVQSEIRWVRNTGPYSPEEELTVDLFNNYFGAGASGMDNLVFKTIRGSKALAYATGAYYMTPNKKEDPYSFFGYVGTQADKTNDAIAGMNDLINSMPESKNDFESAKASLKSALETDRIVDEGILGSYLNARRKGISYDIRKVKYENLGKISFADISNFEQKRLSGKPYTYCIVASDKKIAVADLKQHGEVKTLSLEEIFGY